MLNLSDKTLAYQSFLSMLSENGVCELDERCGPGTILIDGVCELK